MRAAQNASRAQAHPSYANGNGETKAATETGTDDGEGRKGGYRMRVDDVRIALFFLFFVQVAFFGTGK